MECRPVTLTLAFALLLVASSPLRSFSLSTASLLHKSYHLSSDSTISPPPQPRTTNPPPPPPPPPPPSPPPPPPPPPPPSPPHPPPPPPPPPPRAALSAKPNDAQDPPGALGSGRPPGPCSGGATSGCPPHFWSGRPSRGQRRPAAPGERGFNLGEKVGFSFLAAAAVLQLIFGGFLIYARWHIGKVGFEREVALSSSSASSSAN